MPSNHEDFFLVATLQLRDDSCRLARRVKTAIVSNKQFEITFVHGLISLDLLSTLYAWVWLDPIQSNVFYFDYQRYITKLFILSVRRDCLCDWEIHKKRISHHHTALWYFQLSQLLEAFEVFRGWNVSHIVCLIRLHAFRTWLRTTFFKRIAFMIVYPRPIYARVLKAADWSVSKLIACQVLAIE